MNAASLIPQPRKPTPWKVIIPVAIVVVLCCICLVVVGVLAYLGTQGSGPLSMLATATHTSTSTPTLTPTATPTATRTFTPTVELTIVGDWDIYYDWDCDGDYKGPVFITFLPNNTYMLSENSDTAYGTWWMVGRSIDFMFDESPNAHYTGTMDSSYTYMDGTMSTTDGSDGCWYGMIK